MRRAREENQPTAVDRNNRLLYTVRCVATTWTGESTGRAMGEEFRTIVASEATQNTELFEVVVASDEWNRELVKKQERDVFSSRGMKGGLTSRALN